MKTILKLFLIGVCAGCLSGCFLLQDVRDPQTGEVIARSPASQAISGALGGGMSGGPLGALVGGLGGLLGGLGMAWRQERGKRKVLGQVTAGVGEYLQDRDLSAYQDMSVDEVVEMEKRLLRQLLSQKTDEVVKKWILKERVSQGVG